MGGEAIGSWKTQRRLRAIEEFKELDAGFRIAMRDMEIRGAGNLLGKEQHGHIAAVGYDLYCRLLADAVRTAKKESPVPQAVDAAVNLRGEACLPEDYVPVERERIDLYRRLCRVPDGEAIATAACRRRCAAWWTPRGCAWPRRRPAWPGPRREGR